MILSTAGYEVDISLDPLEALGLAQSEFYNVVVLDYMMPKMRGDELAKRLINACPLTEIIFLTGYSEFAAYMETQQDSNCIVLLKPIDSENLLSSVSNRITRGALQSSLSDNSSFSIDNTAIVS